MTKSPLIRTLGGGIFALGLVAAAATSATAATSAEDRGETGRSAPWNATSV